MDIPHGDALLNLIGQDTMVPSYALVKKVGVAVTSNRSPIAEEAKRLGIEAAFVETNAITEGLNAFATLVTEGEIKPQIAAATTLWSPETLWVKRRHRRDFAWLMRRNRPQRSGFRNLCYLLFRRGILACSPGSAV